MNPLNVREYDEAFLKIRTKKGELVPFRYNWAQIELYEALQKQNAQGKPMRGIVLKCRQLGVSTESEGIIYALCATREFTNGLVMAHLDSATANLFAMHKIFWENSPPEIRPMRAAANANELVFDNPDRRASVRAKRRGLGSRIRCMTAGSGGGVGRSFTFRCVHMSEYAFWRGNKSETYTGIMQAVPAEPGTLVIIESTANGFEEFKELWDDAVAGRNDFVPLFFPWWREPSYSMDVPEGTVWDERERALQERFGLDDRQLQWRRWCIRNNCSNSERLFRQEYPSTPDEAFLTSGSGVFDNEIVMRRRSEAPAPVAVGRFDYDYDGLHLTNIRWVDDEYGMIKLYARPRTGAPYVLGGDTAGEGSDFFTGQLIDNTDGTQAAVLRHQFDEPTYSRQMFCLGWYYNRALMAIETNYSTYPMMELRRLGYPRLYMQEVFNKAKNETTQVFGFNTNLKTRPVIISGLQDIVKRTPEMLLDFETLGEMLTFVYNDDRRPEAATGKHDDLVMALAIAHQVRPFQSYVDSVTPEVRAPLLIEKLERGNRRRRRR